LSYNFVGRKQHVTFERISYPSAWNTAVSDEWCWSLMHISRLLTPVVIKQEVETLGDVYSQLIQCQLTRDGLEERMLNTPVVIEPDVTV